MINARATAKVLDAVQAWVTEMSPSSSQLGRDHALRTLFDRLRGLGDGNSSYEDTVINLAKLLEIRMHTGQSAEPIAAVKDGTIRSKERIQCTAVQNIWAETGELHKLRCGRDSGHQGAHSCSFAWKDEPAEVEGVAAA